MKTLRITRSFERTRQIADFVPVKAACEVSVELSEEELNAIPYGAGETSDERAREMFSEKLDIFVRAEVEKTLMGYKPVCVRCGGTEGSFGKGGLTKEGLCQNCNTEIGYQARDHAADVGRNSETPARGTKGRSAT